MPYLSRFYGITITMYFDEAFHPGRPHFHAFHGGEHASFDVRDLSRLGGRPPPRIERLVRRWARDHEEELLENWRRSREKQDPKRIEPLR